MLNIVTIIILHNLTSLIGILLNSAKRLYTGMYGKSISKQMKTIYSKRPTYQITNQIKIKLKSSSQK